jgi:hypothetical protein
VINLQPEIVALRDAGTIDQETAAALLARERREVVNVYSELRFLTWAGVMLVAAGVSVLLSKHIDRIGPAAIAATIAAVSLACYGYSFVRLRAGKHHLADDYVLLLAALLASADLAYVESQFHPFGARWQLHFLIAAMLHAVVAYAFESRLVLSLSIAALAAYIGVERRVEAVLFHSADFARRAFLTAAIVAVWRLAQRKKAFNAVFDHAIAHLSFWGALALTFDDDTRLVGAILTLGIAALSAWYGWRQREEAFVVYAWVYGAIAVDVQACDWLNGRTGCAAFIVVSTIVAIVAIFNTHSRMRKGAT